VAAATATRRRRSANTARIAAKARRQKIVAVLLAVVLVALLAYQVPRLLQRSDSGSAAAAPTAPPATPSAHGSKRLSGSGSGADPFAVESLTNGDARAAAGGGPDPFTASAASTAASAARLPRQIVIGRPGGNRIAKRGWIVILASIPTNNSRSVASRFARGARGSVGRLSVLNSSSRRPLRGGYWVVYSGPYGTLDAVSRRAGAIHAAGYRTAYIRELIAYR
jgi:hypothetical protein